MDGDYSYLTPDKITDRLYLGNYADAENLKKLEHCNIKYILVAGNNLQVNFPEKFKYKVIPIDDEQSTNIEVYFEEVFKFIKEGMKVGGCFVHCAAGVSRSASFVIGFLMSENGWTLNESYQFVKEKRSFIYPNYGFQKQLKKLEVKLGLITKEAFERKAKETLFFIGLASISLVNSQGYTSHGHPIRIEEDEIKNYLKTIENNAGGRILSEEGKLTELQDEDKSNGTHTDTETDNKHATKEEDKANVNNSQNTTQVELTNTSDTQEETKDQTATEDVHHTHAGENEETQ